MQLSPAACVQLYRRQDGGFAYKPDKAPLRAGELLIGRGLTPAEALELIEEFNVTAVERYRRAG